MAEKWILRKGSKANGFRYIGPDGKPVRSRAELARIDALRIPPAWTEVHIARSTRAAVQVWGLDARGRKQYRYHPRAVRRGELRKYHRIRQLGHELPRIGRRLRRDLALPGFPREKVCAGVLLLIRRSFIRVGSERYERENSTFGITTLRKSHALVEGDTVIFRYPGKRAIRQRQTIMSGELARFVAALLKTPGRRLFRYQENDRWQDVTARDVNDYLREVAGFPYTAKDLRTWGGSLRTAIILEELGHAPTERARNRNIVAAVRMVAAELGNTPAICRSSYVHPTIIDKYLRRGTTMELPQTGLAAGRRRFRHTPEETALLEFLDEHFPDRRSRRRMPE